MSRNRGFRKEGVADTRMELSIAKAEQAEFRKSRKQKRHQALGWFMKTIPIECQLYRGDGKYPQTAMLTCTVMGLKNKALVIDYGRKLSEGETDPHLWVWKIIDLPLFKKLKQTHMDSFL